VGTIPAGNHYNPALMQNIDCRSDAGPEADPEIKEGGGY